ncbi:GNAT family N-acetyltransferase [Vibrio sp. JC009]|uniref:GNAT family N-acetyltransferase n=1 Tax=Vibrio sp. JC009 TaxID=2912314 RepID=UPI0023AEF869|nr:GNAT family N-acetyltransferase [Vibrio sp. JC009]WED22294.1 GNAT family N-acetyltransferase [Vibrio sp. JC009]
MKIEFIENPSQEIYKTIHQGLRAYNRQFLADKQEEVQIACVVKNSADEIVGGLNGYIFTTSLFVEHLWLDEKHRGGQLGSKLMQTAESEAKSRGVTDIFLDTYSFQARGFYLKLGFTDVGKYTDYPSKGIEKFFLQKSIQ